MDQFLYIKKSFERQNTGRVYILVHNIDGESLRYPQTQLILSLLATLKQIRIIASIDHLNAPSLWNQGMSMRFNWIWHDVTNYQNYLEETKFDDPIMSAGYVSSYYIY
jgi:origin recognition complex subunit 2